MGPSAKSATEVASEVGVSQPTLSKWRREALLQVSMNPTDPKTPKSPKEWAPEEKLRLMAAAEGVSGEELGALLRREGVHQAQLEGWRRAVAEALKKASTKTKNPDAARVKVLEGSTRRLHKIAFGDR